jgi:DNA polymerase III subunit epsilon
VEFAALDFETTGLDLRRDAVVSFGLVPVRNGRILLGEVVYQEVAPDVPLSSRSVTIHGLRPHDLARAPSLDQVAGVLREALDRRYLLTWTAEIETNFLARVFGGGRRRWVRQTIDVLRMAILLDRLEGRHGSGERPDYRLASTAARYDLPVAEAHHALEDAVTTAQLFLVLASKLEAHGNRELRAFLRLTRRPPIQLWFS